MPRSLAISEAVSGRFWAAKISKKSRVLPTIFDIDVPVSP
jgi:hypothetical protein